MTTRNTPRIAVYLPDNACQWWHCWGNGRNESTSIILPTAAGADYLVTGVSLLDLPTPDFSLPWDNVRTLGGPVRGVRYNSRKPIPLFSGLGWRAWLKAVRKMGAHIEVVS